MEPLQQDRVKLAAQLVRKGATMLAEPCQKDGGVQVRYHGKTYCTTHDDLSSILETKEVSMDSVTADLRRVLLTKLNESLAQLEREADGPKQEQLVTLMTKYFDLLQKLPSKT
jgi:UPF0148 protein